MTSAIFITFSGNCREALTFYQSCFGGNLQIQTFEMGTHFHMAAPVIAASLISDNLTLHGSDLVPDAGRVPGNHLSIFLQCENVSKRRVLLRKLTPDAAEPVSRNDDEPTLIEIVDAFEIRWVLGI